MPCARAVRLWCASMKSSASVKPGFRACTGHGGRSGVCGVRRALCGGARGGAAGADLRIVARVGHDVKLHAGDDPARGRRVEESRLWCSQASLSDPTHSRMLLGKPDCMDARTRLTSEPCSTCSSTAKVRVCLRACVGRRKAALTHAHTHFYASCGVDGASVAAVH